MPQDVDGSIASPLLVGIRCESFNIGEDESCRRWRAQYDVPSGFKSPVEFGNSEDEAIAKLRRRPPPVRLRRFIGDDNTKYHD